MEPKYLTPEESEGGLSAHRLGEGEGAFLSPAGLSRGLAGSPMVPRRQESQAERAAPGPRRGPRALRVGGEGPVLLRPLAWGAPSLALPLCCLSLSALSVTPGCSITPCSL